MCIDISIAQLLNHYNYYFYLLLVLLLIFTINSKKSLLFKNYVSRKIHRGFSLLETLQ